MVTISEGRGACPHCGKTFALIVTDTAFAEEIRESFVGKDNATVEVRSE